MHMMITGSRTITDRAQVYEILDWLPFRPDILVYGTAAGVDQLAAEWARANGIGVEAHPADWSTGRGAGYRRNAEMLAVADIVVGIWDGVSKGTAHALRISLESGKPVYVWLPGHKTALRVA